MNSISKLEIDICQKKIVANYQILLKAAETSSVSLIFTAPALEDNPIVFCSSNFTQLTGYGMDDILGKNCRFLQGKDTLPDVTKNIRQAIEKKEVFSGVILNYKANGQPFENFLRIEPIFGTLGHVEFFLGSQMEVKN